MNDKGIMGEKIATQFLEKQGYEVVSRNYSSRYGEIDIIAKNSEYLIFVEVKARGKSTKSMPCEAVDIKKQRKIIKTALDFLSKHDFSLQPRFDVIEIFDYNAENKINHIENAFDMEIYDESY